MGLTYRGTDLQTPTLHLDIVRGFFEPPEVRGEDDVIPMAAGREEQTRIADRLLIRLEGYVLGAGLTELLRQQSFYATTQALMALMGLTLASGPLVVTPPYLGLPSGTRTVQAKAVGLVGGDVQHCYTYQRWSIDLECIASPPAWV